MILSHNGVRMSQNIASNPYILTLTPQSGFRTRLRRSRAFLVLGPHASQVATSLPIADSSAKIERSSDKQIRARNHDLAQRPKAY